MSPLENDIPLLAIDVHIPEDTSTKNNNVATSQLFQPPTLTELLRAQESDTYCRMGHTQLGHNNFDFKVNNDSLLVQCSRVEGALQIVVIRLHYQCILLLSHYPPIAEHSS